MIDDILADSLKFSIVKRQCREAAGSRESLGSDPKTATCVQSDMFELWSSIHQSYAKMWYRDLSVCPLSRRYIISQLSHKCYLRSDKGWILDGRTDGWINACAEGWVLRTFGDASSKCPELFRFRRPDMFMHFPCSPSNGTLMFTMFTCVLCCFQGSDEGFDTASGRWHMTRRPCEGLRKNMGKPSWTREPLVILWKWATLLVTSISCRSPSKYICTCAEYSHNGRFRTVQWHVAGCKYPPKHSRTLFGGGGWS